MLLGNAETTLCHRRYDLTHPALIFGGLLLAATAICGTLQVPAAPVVPVEEVLVLNDEGVVAPDNIDPFALSCDVKNTSNTSASFRPVSTGGVQPDCHQASSQESAQSEDGAATQSGSSSSSGSLH